MTYSYATTVSQASVPVFSEDISALSHELGEWIMDPFIDNMAPTLCSERGNGNSLLEVGDPLENNPDFGTYPYSVNGFIYHPPDLVTIEYFGAPANTSVNNFFTFQGEKAERLPEWRLVDNLGLEHGSSFLERESADHFLFVMNFSGDCQKEREDRLAAKGNG
jgi:hypothetical protein